MAAMSRAGGSAGAPSTSGAGGSFGETGTCTSQMVVLDRVDNFSLDTEEAICIRVAGDIEGWGVSNFDGRTITVNGEVVQPGGALPPKLNGYYYFDISAGDFSWAAVVMW